MKGSKDLELLLFVRKLGLEKVSVGAPLACLR